jgi:ADP-dependent NAD(P)H-hydrate dehydratase / NAD(P)H-hydrate epimerase
LDLFRDHHMKIFSKEQLALIDRQTIAEENIPETELMERASRALADWIVTYYSPASRVAVVAGPGNNGGDALAVARMLAGLGYAIDVFLPELSKRRSDASQVNMERLREDGNVRITELAGPEDFPELNGYHFILDGLYGSGLSRPLEGFAAATINWMNASGTEIVSIDLPSGLMCDENRYNQGAIVRATYTLTLEFPKLSLFFRENEPFFGNWEIVPFGLSQKAVDETKTGIFYLDQSTVSAILKRRKVFSHKGSYGHGLLIAGSQGKYGAAQLAARGALRAGLGLLTVHLPESAGNMLNITLPEAMTTLDKGKNYITELPELKKYTAIAAGPGLGIESETQSVVIQLIDDSTVPLVLDADALNILSIHPEWLKKLAAKTILTPHPVEFDRLSGIVMKTEEERFFMAREFAGSYGVILILKGAFTRIFFPDGTICFNSTGNPGMATGGSGDVLTGILLGLLCQGYSLREAALLGVFLHGRSADLRVETSSEESLIAGEIADYLGEAFASIK